MKTYLILFAFCFISLVSIAQKKEFEDSIYDNPKGISISEPNMIHNFYIENNGMVYKYVYEANGLSQTQIVEKLNAVLSNSTGIVNVKFTDNEFVGRIEDFTIDYRKFGGKLITAWTALNYPMFADFKIQVKDLKYRLIITSIEFINPSPYFIYDVYGLATKNNRTQFTDKNPILKGLEFIDKTMTERFKLSIEKANDNW
jgi:hypothetical protein